MWSQGRDLGKAVVEDMLKQYPMMYHNVSALCPNYDVSFCYRIGYDRPNLVRNRADFGGFWVCFWELFIYNNLPNYVPFVNHRRPISSIVLLHQPFTCGLLCLLLRLISEFPTHYSSLPFHFSASFVTT